MFYTRKCTFVIAALPGTAIKYYEILLAHIKPNTDCGKYNLQFSTCNLYVRQQRENGKHALSWQMQSMSYPIPRGLRKGGGGPLLYIRMHVLLPTGTGSYWILTKKCIVINHWPWDACCNCHLNLCISTKTFMIGCTCTLNGISEHQQFYSSTIIMIL